MRICPRDKRILRAATIGEASVDVCGKCEGTFFDSEDLIGAAGTAADPSTWDRAETGGILVTPTLVLVQPFKGRRIVGDLSVTDRVLFGLGLRQNLWTWRRGAS